MSEKEKRLDELLGLAVQPGDTFLELAAKLHEYYERDPRDLDAFLRASGMGKRKAYYFIQLGKQLQGLRLPRDQLARIGWSKVQLIAKYLDADNAADLLNKAETYSTQALTTYLRGGEPDKEMHRVQLYLTSKQYRLFEQAVIDNGGERLGRGLANKEAAVMKIIRRIRRVELQAEREEEDDEDRKVRTRAKQGT